jgi:hypothetical protein
MQQSATTDSGNGAQSPVASQPAAAAAAAAGSRTATTGRTRPTRPDQQSSVTTATPSASAARRRPPEEDPSDHWTYELFGCLTDWRLCCATFCLPCYTMGRNAQYFGDDGTLTGLLCGLGLFAVGISQKFDLMIVLCLREKGLLSMVAVN